MHRRSSPPPAFPGATSARAPSPLASPASPPLQSFRRRPWQVCLGWHSRELGTWQHRAGGHVNLGQGCGRVRRAPHPRISPHLSSPALLTRAWRALAPHSRMASPRSLLTRAEAQAPATQRRPSWSPSSGRAAMPLISAATSRSLSPTSSTSTVCLSPQPSAAPRPLLAPPLPVRLLPSLLPSAPPSSSGPLPCQG